MLRENFVLKSMKNYFMVEMEEFGAVAGTADPNPSGTRDKGRRQQ